MLRYQLMVGLIVVALSTNIRMVDAQDASSPSSIEPIGKVEKVQDGFEFTEGPAWSDGGKLYFTDIRAKTIYELADGKLAAFTTDSKTANGLIFTKAGRLIACQMEGQVAAYDPETGQETVLAAEYNGKRFNAPNDLVIDQRGGIYFTDPHYRAPEPWPQTILAVYYISREGTVSRVTDHIEAPNGVALSPDEKRLYVVPSGQAEMLVYDIGSPGRLSRGRTFCRLKQADGQQNGGGDGLAVDVRGNLYITSGLGVQIFSPAGQPLGIVKLPEVPANVTFGGPDRKTLYATARTSLYKVRMPIAGLPSN